MEGSFTKPASKIYRRFLYLDGEEVINSLSGLEGGDIDEILTQTSTDDVGGSDIGVDLKAVKGRRAKQARRGLIEAVRQKRTLHSAATSFLDKLHERNAIGIVHGEYTPEVYEQFEDRMLVELEANVRLHPLHQALAATRELTRAASAFGAEKANINELREIEEVIRLVAHGSSKSEDAVLVFIGTDSTPDEYRIVARLEQRNVLVNLNDLGGTATVVGQIAKRLRHDDEIQVVRVLKNAPLLEFERETLAEAIPELVGALSLLGIETSIDDFILRRPAVMLKPLWIFR